MQLQSVCVLALDAPETKVVRAGTDFAFAAGSDDVPRAILVCAKKRAAAMYLLGVSLLDWVKRRLWALRIPGHAAQGS